MADLLQALLEASGTPPPFPPNSRYHGVATAVRDTPAGPVVYLRRRFIAPPEAFALLHEHAVVEGDRLDNLAAATLGDPELAWRIADANGALRPDDLTATPGRRLRITLPEGLSGGIPGA